MKSENQIEIGMGATMCIGSDRYAYTVIGIERGGKTLILQQDIQHLRIGGSDTETQTYLYTRNPNGWIEKATLRKDGVYRAKGKHGGYVYLDARDAKRDPSF